MKLPTAFVSMHTLYMSHSIIDSEQIEQVDAVAQGEDLYCFQLPTSTFKVPFRTLRCLVGVNFCNVHFRITHNLLLESQYKIRLNM